jgi:hypothetical protein
LQWPSTSERKFKRNTERMPFVIRRKTWQALFQRNKTKKKLAKLERKEYRKRKKK